ncbi:terminase gpP N-terminus-related DNA-binding protein [Paenibacillus sp. QZ-Y1]
MRSTEYERWFFHRFQALYLFLSGFPVREISTIIQLSEKQFYHIYKDV